MLFFVWRNTGKSVMDYASCADKSTGQDEYIEVRFNFPLLPRRDDEDQFSIGKRRKRVRGDVSGVHGYNNSGPRWRYRRQCGIHTFSLTASSLFFLKPIYLCGLFY